MTCATLRALTVLTAMIASACGGSAPVPATPPNFTIASEAVSPSTDAVFIDIRVPSTATQDAIKAAVQVVVDGRKNRFKSIWVRTYFDGSSGAAPDASSYYDGSAISHEFSGRLKQQQKIATH